MATIPRKSPENIGVREWLPAETGINGVNLKVDSDEYQGDIIDLSGYKHFEFIFKHVIVGTTPTLGTIDLYMYPYLDDGVTESGAMRTVYSDQPISGEPASTRFINLALNTETGIIQLSRNGLTLGTLTTEFKWQVLGKCMFGIGPWEASDAGTSHVGSLIVRAST